MSNVTQVVEWYRNFEDIAEIYEDMRSRIGNGWRVHTCLERRSDVLVIYEKSI
jgi:hypothetical protein